MFEGSWNHLKPKPFDLSASDIGEMLSKIMAVGLYTPHSFRINWTLVEKVVFQCIRVESESHVCLFQFFVGQTWLIVLVRSQVWNVFIAVYQHEHSYLHADCRAASIASRRTCKGYSLFCVIRWVFQVPIGWRKGILKIQLPLPHAAQARYPPLLEDVEIIARPEFQAKEEAPTSYNPGVRVLESLAETISWLVIATWHLEPSFCRLILCFTGYLFLAWFRNQSLINHLLVWRWLTTAFKSQLVSFMANQVWA